MELQEARINTEAHDTLMENEKTQDTSRPFEQHEFYRLAMQQIAEGEDEAAVANLRSLIDLYPDEEGLRDLLVRTNLRTATVVPEEVSRPPGPPPPILRRVILLLMFVAVLLAGAVAFAVAYENFVRPVRELASQRAKVANLREDFEGYLDDRALPNARATLGELDGALKRLEALGGERFDAQEIEDAYRRLEAEEELSRLYEDALELIRQERWSEALSLLLRIQEIRPDYEKVPELIEEVRQRLALEAAWEEAERLVQAEDWLAAIERLTWIRAQDPEYRRGDVSARLFQINSLLARQELDQARGEVERIESAIEYLGKALQERPTQRDLVDELNRARDYVEGARANAAGDWVAAVEAWEEVYLTGSAYWDGVLEPLMQEVWPRAAKALIKEANGDPVKLRQAIDYLKKALYNDPENQELLAEHHFAKEYLEGADAYAKERWDEAITIWGPIHDLRPEYQNGLLEENLKTSCANSTSPSETWCP